MIPMEMTAPSQGMNSNILAGLTGDILKKVTKNITETMSQHATDALNQGVPYGHILDELIKMSPVSAGMAIGKDMDMAVGGGGGKPPSPNGNGGGPKPPQPPQAAAKQDQSQTPIAATTDNATLVQPQQEQAQPPVDANSIISQLLATMQQSNGKQILPPNGLFSKQGFDQNGNMQMGGFLDFQGSNMKNLGAAQELLGQKPMQIGDLQKIIAGVGGEQLSANTVPLNAAQRAEESYRQKQLSAGAYTAQLDNAKEQINSLNQEQERATAEFNAMVNSRAGWRKFASTPEKAMEQFKAKLDNIAERRDKAQQNLLGLYGNHPNLKKADTLNSKELVGKTIGKYKIVSVK